MTRPPHGAPMDPPLTRAQAERPGRAQWNWPDPSEVAPPRIPASYKPVRRTVEPLAARWPVQPLPGSWPPLPGGAEVTLRDNSVDDEDLFAPAPQSAEYSDAPQPEVQGGVDPLAYSVQAAPFAAGAAAANIQDMPMMGWVEAPLPRDPSPSRIVYRLNRMWLTPAVRHFVRVGVPVILTCAVLAGWLSDEGRRAQVIEAANSVRLAVENRPEFQVVGMNVISRSPDVARGVEAALGVAFPISSFHLDYEDLRATAEALDVVETASVRVRDGQLEVRIQERLPAMVWRDQSGLFLVDATGHRIARLAERAARADLPLIVGVGAPDAIQEAQELLSAMTPLRHRLIGLVRMGERRWDVVLDRDQRILLPQRDALSALERVLALDAAQGLLARDVTVVDMRNPSRPTLRMSASAAEELNRIRQLSSGVSSR